jgi:quinol monooxygenase YgiN
MITFIAQMRVKPENADTFEALMTYVCDMTLGHEPGVAYYAWSKGVDEPGTYLVIEVYRDVAAQAAHMATEWVKGSLPKSVSLIEGVPVIKQYAMPGCEPVTQRLFQP